MKFHDEDGKMEDFEGTEIVVISWRIMVKLMQIDTEYTKFSKKQSVFFLK